MQEPTSADGDERLPRLMNARIRDATAGDVRGLAEVHVRSWQGAYRGLLPDEYLDSLDADLERREELWRQAVEAPPEKGCLLAAEEEGRIVGFVIAGATRDEGEDRERVGEIWSIYVHPDRWGCGIGKALHDRAIEHMRARGFEEATLWVLDTNERTRGWYERQGWRTDGAAKTDERPELVLNEVRYRTKL